MTMEPNQMMTKTWDERQFEKVQLSVIGKLVNSELHSKQHSYGHGYLDYIVKKKKGSSSWKKFENPPLVNSYFLLF